MLDDDLGKSVFLICRKRLGIVGTSIINENDFVRNPHHIQYCFNFLAKGFEGTGFIREGIAEKEPRNQRPFFKKNPSSLQ